MGDAEHELIISFNPTQLKAIIEALRPADPAEAPEPQRPTVPSPDELLAMMAEVGIEPWTFQRPKHPGEGQVTAYVDDHNQVRHVALSQIEDVPKHWRRIYLA